MSEIGYCSRRAADKLIDTGKVAVNGIPAQLGTRVMPGDEVKVNGRTVRANTDNPVYLALNKPEGIVCTTDRGVEKDNIIDFIGYPKRIYPVGRLDKRSEGLILLTDDGEIVNQILRARHRHEKEYIVTVDKAVTPEFLNAMRNGVPILDTVTRKCEVEALDAHTFRIVLTQGLNRQIRRMCEHLGYRVLKLKRIRIMNIKLDMPVGKWRHLTHEELEQLRKSLHSTPELP